MNAVKLPKFMFREGAIYVLRHPNGDVIPLGASLLEAKAKHAELLAARRTTGAKTAADYRRLNHPMWAQVDVRERSQCWPWRGNTDRDGYGVYRSSRAHRLAWADYRGRPILVGMVIRHRCDNPGCCNPWHLEEGTQEDNVRDRDVRDRTAKGSANGRARLEDADALEIAASRDTYAAIAARFGVSIATVGDIKTGRNWGWLTGRATRSIPAKAPSVPTRARNGG